MAASYTVYDEKEDLLSYYNKHKVVLFPVISTYKGISPYINRQKIIYSFIVESNIK